jgi:hypothetical protein
MWISGIGDKGKKMEDIAYCFISFPRLRDDIEILIAEGIIEHSAFDIYDWTRSKTSLAEYFNWIGRDVTYVPGGFWAPVEKTFRIKRGLETEKIKRGSLRKLAGNNANPLKPPESGDFIKIKKMVLAYRAKIRQQEKDKTAFNAIKKLIEKDRKDDPEKIREILVKIKKIIA